MTSRRPSPFTAPLALLLAAAVAAVAGCGGPARPAPITAPTETWTWIPVEGTRCGNGTATGIGVNLTSRSRDVVIYFQGGGACWDATTCLVLHTASHLESGYGVAELATEWTLTLAAFDRTVAGNPFKDASLVFVPYCTGDLHAGTAVNDYGGTTIHHAGGINTGLILDRLAATFPGARRVYVTGSSAGGYAAQLNYSRVAARLPAAELHLLADGAQAINPANGNLAAWLAAWKPILPAGCAACSTDLTALPAWLAATWPARRFALTASMQDEVLQSFFGYGPAGLSAATQSLLTGVYAPTANARWFAVDTTAHTMLGGLTTISNGGVTLQGWLTAWYTGDPAWASAGP